MMQSLFGLAQAIVSGVEFGVTLLCRGALYFAETMDAIGMDRGGKREKFLLEKLRVQPGAAGSR